MTSLLVIAITALAAIPATQPHQHAPDRVILKELVNLYEPVPFDHRGHADMAQMWGGCETCHHRKPQVQWRGAAGPHVTAPQRVQADANKIPACKSCHRVGEETANIHMPNLKGAYHRQCLNCHKEWMHDNACVICHAPRNAGGKVATSTPLTPDDITGRMHPPIAAPDTRVYKARFTPAPGANVTFRHKTHIEHYGLTCASCHRRDTCANCHDGTTKAIAIPPIKPGRTWQDSHAPCVTCHQEDRCAHCHYKDDQPIPPPFDHKTTSQVLDADHVNLKCGECHQFLRSTNQLSCGSATCHKRPVAFPKDRPGPVIARPMLAQTRPAATRPSIQSLIRAASNGGAR